MEGDPRNSKGCPNLIDLMPWIHKNHENDERIHASSDEKKLELSLAPPGEPIWSSKSNNGYPKKERDVSLFSLGHITHNNQQKNQRNDVGAPWPSQVYQQNQHHHQQQHQHQHQSGKVSFLQQYQTGHGGVSIGKESSQRMVDLQNGEKNKAFSSSSPANTSVPNNTSQKRAAPASVVGWPPLRSFRKNLASGSSGKTSPEPEGKAVKTTENEKPVENSRKGMFVKINMDGVPIGRKIDLHAYDTYDKLSLAVDELFRGLLAAQKDPSSSGNKTQAEEEKAITGLLDGKGEYTLVYEDNEGDRMLVGDVPWNMFVSNVKRLRVLKSSDLPSLNRNGRKQEKEVLMECAA